MSELTKLGSLSPKVWGHAGWKFLFAIASVYPEGWAPPETRHHYYTYFSSLTHVLPCEICRRHYNDCLLYTSWNKIYMLLLYNNIT